MFNTYVPSWLACSHVVTKMFDSSLSRVKPNWHVTHVASSKDNKD